MGHLSSFGLILFCPLPPFCDDLKSKTMISKNHLIFWGQLPPTFQITIAPPDYQFRSSFYAQLCHHYLQPPSFCRTPTRSDHEVRLSSPPTHPPPTTLSSEIEFCTSDSPTPPNPYIFWKLVTRAIQRRQRDTNTMTMTMTNTMTKTKTVTKTKRLKAAHLTVPRPQTHTFSESSCQQLFKNGNVTQIQRQ